LLTSHVLVQTQSWIVGPYQCLTTTLATPCTVRDPDSWPLRIRLTTSHV
jgi:hypothetical protein